MYTQKALFFLCIVLMLFCTGCQSDFFRFSSETEDDPSRQYKPQEWLAYCNNFNKNGFQGILTAYFDADIEDFSTNKVWLHLSSVPKEFEYPKTNYIQIHPFNVDSNKIQHRGSPIDMKIIKDSDKEIVKIISSIQHTLLEEMGYLDSINALISNYGFVLLDLSGWEGVSLSVFNVKNVPVSKTSIRVLIPPFLSHPHNYSQRNNNELLLSRLHPFENIATTTNFQTEDIFYNKASDICDNSPIKINIPSFQDQIHSKEEEASDQLFNRLLEDVSDLTN